MTRFRTPTIALVVALLVMAYAEFGAAAPEKSGPAPVEGLGDRLLGDWGLPPSADPGSSAGRVPLPNVDESRRQLDSPSKAEQAGEDIGKQGTSPLERISNRMHEAHQLIDSQTTSGKQSGFRRQSSPTSTNLSSNLANSARIAAADNARILDSNSSKRRNRLPSRAKAKSRPPRVQPRRLHNSR